jgi:hypothetical protein
MMNREAYLKIRHPIIIISILLCSTPINSQEQNAEIRAFREEVEHTAKSEHPSLEKYQKTILKNLERKEFYQSEPTDWTSNTEEPQTPTPLNETPEYHEPRRSTSVASGSFNYIVLIFGTFALIAIVLFFVQKIRKNLITDAKPDFSQPPADTPMTENDALEQAEQFETDHDFREAIRALYLVALLHLQERGFLSYDRSRTNREYLSELKANPNLEHALRPVIHTFDEVWYGYKPCDAETVTEYRELLPKVYEACR